MAIDGVDVLGMEWEAFMFEFVGDGFMDVAQAGDGGEQAEGAPVCSAEDVEVGGGDGVEVVFA